MPAEGCVVGVDGGGSKTHAAVADLAGRVLGESVEVGSPHTALGFAGAAAVVDRAVWAALAAAGVAPAAVLHAGCYLSGVDLPEEAAALTAELAAHPWTDAGLTVDNDVLAVLRAGTQSADAAAVVCGTGMNAVAVRADGARAQLLAMGAPSGDWGGGLGLADEVLWHAARAEDGRGPGTALREALLGWTGAASVRELAIEVAGGRRRTTAWVDRVPEVLALARAGDDVARALVQRQGVEIATCAAAVLARLGLAARRVPVVVGGGIGTSGDAQLEAAIRAGLAERAPLAELVVLRTSPVLGAVRLALASLSPPSGAPARRRSPGAR
ncbi:MAG TPA: BadF/BadG/BcrA/BcrD ATPase family protein [Candidatus Nanopelagicales bacterium]